MKPLNVVEQGPFTERAVANKPMIQIEHQRGEKEPNYTNTNLNQHFYSSPSSNYSIFLFF